MCQDNAPAFRKERKAPELLPPRVQRRCVWEWSPPSAGKDHCCPSVPFLSQILARDSRRVGSGSCYPPQTDAVIKWKLEAFNYQYISILRTGKQHLVYYSRGSGKKCLFLPLIKRILLNSQRINCTLVHLYKEDNWIKIVSFFPHHNICWQMALLWLRKCSDTKTHHLLPQKYLIHVPASSSRDIVTIIYICEALHGFQTHPRALSQSVLLVGQDIFITFVPVIGQFGEGHLRGSIQ